MHHHRHLLCMQGTILHNERACKVPYKVLGNWKYLSKDCAQQWKCKSMLDSVEIRSWRNWLWIMNQLQNYLLSFIDINLYHLSFVTTMNLIFFNLRFFECVFWTYFTNNIGFVSVCLLCHWQRCAGDEGSCRRRGSDSRWSSLPGVPSEVWKEFHLSE